jgi:hypothetical protein
MRSWRISGRNDDRAPRPESEGRQVRTRELVAGVVLAGAVLAGAVVAQATPAAAAGSHPTTAQALYRQTVASTRSWSVHYVSTSTKSKVTLRLSGDAGPASGSQSVLMGTASISILVIGGFTYLRGSASGLQNLAGLSASQAAATAGRWIEFATDNPAFAPVVAGVRSHDLANELKLSGPLSLGRPRTLDGHAVEAVKGTQKIGRRSVHVVLYVRAHGTHVPVEEDSVDARGRSTAIEHVVYSKWGEHVRPHAPQASVSIGSINSV